MHTASIDQVATKYGSISKQQRSISENETPTSTQIVFTSDTVLNDYGSPVTTDKRCMHEKVVQAQEWYTPTSFVNAQDCIGFSMQLQPHGRAKRSTQHIGRSDRQNRKVG